MKKNKTELQNYLETGVLGSCDYAQSSVQPEQGGMVSTRFEDAVVATGSEGKRVRRVMMVDKRNFLVSSFFPTAAATPTERLLEYIDLREKKK